MTTNPIARATDDRSMDQPSTLADATTVTEYIRSFKEMVAAKAKNVAESVVIQLLLADATTHLLRSESDEAQTLVTNHFNGMSSESARSHYRQMGEQAVRLLNLEVVMPNGTAKATDYLPGSAYELYLCSRLENDQLRTAIRSGDLTSDISRDALKRLVHQPKEQGKNAANAPAWEADKVAVPLAFTATADTAVPRLRIGDALLQVTRVMALAGMDIQWKKDDAIRRLSDGFVPKRQPIDAIVRVNVGGPEVWGHKVAEALCRQVIDREPPSTVMATMTAYLTQQATVAVRTLMERQVATMHRDGTDVRVIRQDLAAAPVDPWIGIAVTPRIIGELLKIDDERCRSAAGTTPSLLAQAVYVIASDEDIADEIRFAFEQLRIRIQKRISHNPAMTLEAVLTEMGDPHKVPSPLAA
ncbi:MAG: hypothetical protein A3I61_13395 [Acidobacteria bacterium RIFCSPLOWO2_02_FULL_68_18]|nr:MAG: hypothetical protein A3I61_13395 [Acidobacteria bacterium RIFCSPLOWO2_02_FULL_68_18]